MTQYLGNALGTSLMDVNGTITFDPSLAKLDHVSNKVRQAMQKPAQYGKNGYVEVGEKTYFNDSVSCDKSLQPPFSQRRFEAVYFSACKASEG
jgi:hypothetical protein